MQNKDRITNIHPHQYTSGEGRMDGPNGGMWTASELDGRSKVNGLLKKSCRPRGKIDGFSTVNGRFVKKWAVQGSGVK